MRDPLAVDALLVVLGSVLALVIGVGTLANDQPLSAGAVVAGFTLPFGLAVAAPWYADRVRPAVEWASGPAETPRERLRFVLPLAALVLARFVVLPRLPTAVWQGLGAAGAGMVALALGRAAGRAAGLADTFKPQ